MTPLEGETALIGLIVAALAPWVVAAPLLWKRIIRVSTASVPKQAIAPKPDAEPVTAPLPITDTKPVRGVA